MNTIDEENLSIFEEVIDLNPSVKKAKTNSLASVLIQINLLNRRIDILQDCEDAIAERFNEIESQIVANSRLIRQKNQQKRQAKYGFYVAAIALILAIGININKSEQGLIIRYDSSNLINLLVPIVGGGGALFSLIKNNKADKIEAEAETIF